MVSDVLDVGVAVPLSRVKLGVAFEDALGRSIQDVVPYRSEGSWQKLQLSYSQSPLLMCNDQLIPKTLFQTLSGKWTRR